MFHKNREILFHPILNHQLYKIVCQLMYTLNCFIRMRKSIKKLYTVGDLGLDELGDPYSYYKSLICLHWPSPFDSISTQENVI